ncbi:MAG: DUF1648 domain-containing protein [Candidatus Altiarchaeota archaeon]
MMDKKDYASIILIAAMFAAAAYIYPQLPNDIAVHWNAEGKADSYGPKAIGTFTIPLLTMGIYVLFLIIPAIEVFKENLKAFMNYYNNMKLLLVLFMTALYSATIIQNMGYVFNMNLAVIPALAILLYYIGHIMPHMKRSFFVGIRTPWTLANEKVWNETHKVGSKTFKANAVLIALSLLIPGSMVWVILASVPLNTIFLIAYSYWLYRRENKNELEGEWQRKTPATRIQ